MIRIHGFTYDGGGGVDDDVNDGTDDDQNDGNDDDGGHLPTCWYLCRLCW